MRVNDTLHTKRRTDSAGTCNFVSRDSRVDFLTYSKRSDDVNHSDRKFTTDLSLLWFNKHRISACGNIFELTSWNDSRIYCTISTKGSVTRNIHFFLTPDLILSRFMAILDNCRPNKKVTCMNLWSKWYSSHRIMIENLLPVNAKLRTAQKAD